MGEGRILICIDGVMSVSNNGFEDRVWVSFLFERVVRNFLFLLFYIQRTVESKDGEKRTKGY